MYNRNQSQRQNPQDIPIFVDHSATPAGPFPVNNNNPFILRPIANNQQVPLPARLPHISTAPFPVEYWRSATTLPTDPTSPTMLYADPQALARAQATQYPPQGEPVITEVQPFGYQVRGEWHIGYLNNALYQRQERIHPDVTPIWTYNRLQTLDSSYRNMNITVPGTVWPTAAVGMTSNLSNLRAIEGSGIHIWNIDPNGYIQWMWQGTQ
ncbi:hypothetical protein BGZ61DRAFT_363329 [Ilyonectria robusta]|uniref:uncharacterized protein n=1 Tax=Ilyonectria robusta TaxID=1079257 RepID=UPI001E8CCCB0|nr:uncharacterized protein BGZ61DRAFT_363329 [Ilyonectria robusta]KAH8670772.1 hypothetical protein BGZ61DRAFT_363329 [Ilyonectria robusta]